MSREKGIRPREGGEQRRESLRVGRREAGLRLDLFLVTALGISRKQAKRLVDGRQVAVDGRIEPMASRILQGRESVQVAPPPAPASEERPPHSVGVVFEDEHCLALDKPSGLPSGPTRDPKRVHAALLAQRLAGRPLTLLHRLDKDTSGLLLLGKTREFSSALLEDFRRRRVEKTYLALVQGAPQDRFEVVSHLKEAPGDRILTVRSGGMRAETEFRVLARGGGCALVEARPRTGRTHQIRVHLAGQGCPILGDGLYGGSASAGGEAVPRQMLHAWRLGFRHPATGRFILLEAPLAPDFRRIAAALLGRLPHALHG